MKRLRFIYKYFYHLLSARNTRGHGIHSPFCYQFTQSVIYDKSSFYIFQEIEKLRTELKKNTTTLNIKDLGTGNSKTKTVGKIAETSLKSARFSQLFFRLINYFAFKNVLELGTSLGITTLYLSTASSSIRCKTIEGCPEILAVANDNFHKMNIQNIETKLGNIDEILLNTLNDSDKLDFIFIDANHKFPNAYNYFEMCLSKIHDNSVIVVDDIYWSNDMEKVWKLIKNHPLVQTTFDLFHIGIVFFNPDLHKNHYKMCV